MALIIKQGARKPIAGGGVIETGISPHGYGRVTGPGCEFRVGAIRVVLSVAEARELDRQWRTLYAAEGLSRTYMEA